jgi:hypothetical protein
VTMNDRLKYQAIDPISREEMNEVLLRDDAAELLRAVIAVALHADDGAWATSVCMRLAAHPHFNVRGNAILGLGHLARRGASLDPAAREVIAAGLRDADDYVRGQAHAAADDVEQYLGWQILRPS